MAYHSRSRIVPIILIIIIMIIAVAAIVSLARSVFFSGSSNNQVTEQVDMSREALLNTSVDRQVRMTVRGSIVADEEFYSYRIAVTPSSRSLVTYNGYLGQQIDAVQLGNNIPAYEEFVHALDKANLAKGTQFDEAADDTRGICATGRLYEFEIIYGEEIIKRLWTSTCDGSPGSLDAAVSQLTNLFTAQIPDSQSIIRKISL